LDPRVERRAWLLLLVSVLSFSYCKPANGSLGLGVPMVNDRISYADLAGFLREVVNVEVRERDVFDGSGKNASRYFSLRSSATFFFSLLLQPNELLPCASVLLCASSLPFVTSRMPRSPFDVDGSGPSPTRLTHVMVFVPTFINLYLFFFFGSIHTTPTDRHPLSTRRSKRLPTIRLA